MARDDIDYYTGSLSDLELREIMSKVEGNIKGYMNKTDIAIRDTPPTSVTIPFKPQQHMVTPPRNTLTMAYERLLVDKIADPAMRQKAIDYAEIMLQEGTWCNIQLVTDKGGVGSVKAVCCLPEHGQAFVNWWNDKDIDSQNFEPLVRKFELQMKSNRIAAAIGQQEPVPHGKVKKVITTFYTR